MLPIEPDGIRNFLKEHFNLGSDLIEVMLGSLKESLSLELENAAKGIAEKDPQMIRKAAHSIKGALLNAGASDWAEIAKKMEMLSKEENVDCEGLLIELKNGLQCLS